MFISSRVVEVRLRHEFRSFLGYFAICTIECTYFTRLLLYIYTKIPYIHTKIRVWARGYACLQQKIESKYKFIQRVRL